MSEYIRPLEKMLSSTCLNGKHVLLVTETASVVSRSPPLLLHLLSCAPSALSATSSPVLPSLVSNCYFRSRVLPLLCTALAGRSSPRPCSAPPHPVSHPALLPPPPNHTLSAACMRAFGLRSPPDHTLSVACMRARGLRCQVRNFSAECAHRGWNCFWSAQVRIPFSTTPTCTSKPLPFHPTRSSAHIFTASARSQFRPVEPE